MAIVASRAQIGLKKTGSTVHVPDDPRAKLMFYLNCMCNVLDLDDPNMSRLTNYGDYWCLSAEEEGKLLLLCLMLSPDVLSGKCIFLDEEGEMCGNSKNAFFELSAVQNRVVVTQDILIGNEQRHVKTIMFYKMSFISDNFIEPMVVLKPRLDALLGIQQGTSRAAITYNESPRVVDTSDYDR
ncbi:hypothetical protein FSP39_025221 [Pinctada imbricata]|uniref:Uncharacterized protein n=1 Tax=Pinctada imbricata TaxID=66713 RepID=A0AA88XW78_PINIB|nr:hypothetical protein FSP39_025221 [Pinctada imbricata]